MSTHKHIEIICIIILLLTVFITVLFVNSEKFGVKTETKTPAYTESLFDTTKVHTIDIVVENKEDFIANCKSEEYYLCDVTIDGETIQNAAIRGKGNTSLTQVDSYENDRYSFKLEFDHYNNGQTFQGLDKLCLNNIIQDHTYMKEFITYQMMNSIGAATPLCSYAYITLNGEEWGLYMRWKVWKNPFWNGISVPTTANFINPTAWTWAAAAATEGTLNKKTSFRKTMKIPRTMFSKTKELSLQYRSREAKPQKQSPCPTAKIKQLLQIFFLRE